MEDTLHIDLIAKYLSGNIEAMEREQLWAWVEADVDNRKFFDQMVQLWAMSVDYEEAPFSTDTNAGWSKVESRLFDDAAEAPIIEIRPKPSSKIVPLSKKRGWWAAAAVILLAISVNIWIYTKPTDNQLVVYETGANERQQYTLPDSSKIWLNENTRLSFDKNFEPRVVQLEGEAFFEVEHLENELPFTIRSGEASTTVLGTTFNVRAYPAENQVEVTVKTGKVGLTDVKDVKKTKFLVAGKSGVFDKKTEEVKIVAVPLENADAWKTQQLEFDETPMSEVVQTLERYYNVKIKVENPAILSCPINIDKDSPNWQQMIGTIEFLLPVKIEKQDSVYVIRGNGCK